MEAFMEARAAILQKLTELREEIRGRLERIAGDAKKPLDADFEEQAVERENAEVLVALDRFIRAEMAWIEKTLARLNKGEYGVCEGCDDPITPKRLETLSLAARCVVCEGKAVD
jgi:RNA polymerase-binding transcription factor DksA